MKRTLVVTTHEQEAEQSRAYWRAQTPEARLDAVEQLRLQAGRFLYEYPARLQRVVAVLEANHSNRMPMSKSPIRKGAYHAPHEGQGGRRVTDVNTETPTVDRTKLLATTNRLRRFVAWVTVSTLVACLCISAPEILAYLGGRFGINEFFFYYLVFAFGWRLVLAALVAGAAYAIYWASRSGRWRALGIRFAGLAAVIALGVGLALAVTQFLPDRDDVRLMGVYERVKKNVDAREVRAWMHQRAEDAASTPKCPPSLLPFLRDERWLQESDGVVRLALSGGGFDLWDSGILFTSEPDSTPPQGNRFFNRDLQILWLVRPGVWVYEGFRYPFYEDDWE